MYFLGMALLVHPAETGRLLTGPPRVPSAWVVAVRGYDFGVLASLLLIDRVCPPPRGGVQTVYYLLCPAHVPTLHTRSRDFSDRVRLESGGRHCHAA